MNDIDGYLRPSGGCLVARSSERPIRVIGRRLGPVPAQRWLQLALDVHQLLYVPERHLRPAQPEEASAMHICKVTICTCIS